MHTGRTSIVSNSFAFTHAKCSRSGGWSTAIAIAAHLQTSSLYKLCCRREAARCFVSICLYLNSTIEPTSSVVFYYWLQINQCVQLNSDMFSSAYPSTDINDVDVCCRKQDSLVRGASSSASAAINFIPRSKLLTTLEQSSIPKSDIGRESRFLPTPQTDAGAAESSDVRANISHISK